MLHVGLELSFEVLEEVLAATVLELERNKAKIAHPGPKDDVEVITVIVTKFLFISFIEKSISFIWLKWAILKSRIFYKNRAREEADLLTFLMR